MGIRRFVVYMLSSICAAASAGVACSQSFPSKPIRIVTSETGGGNDFTARAISPELSNALGQQVIVDNRGGAGGLIAIDTVAKAQPDGYTLVLYNNGMWTLPLIQKLPYDPVRDFSPITLATTTPNILVVHPTVPVNSVKDLIALAKSKPGELNYATGGTGSSNHLAAELFNSMAGVKTVRIPHKGSGPALIGLMGGQTQLMFPNAAAVTPHLKSGRLKALAVTSLQPSILFPGLPTVAASLPGYESVSPFGIFAPAQTPVAVVRRLNQEIVKVLARADVRERFLNTGVEVVGSTPEEFASAMKADITRLSKVVKESGIRAD